MSADTELDAVRWLFIKDLQILRRSPLLVGLLVVYPIAIALMIGFALSSPPGKPTVAILNEVPPGKDTSEFGNQEISISKYAKQLFDSIQPLPVNSRDEAIAKVRSGAAAAALIVPADITTQIQNLVTQGVGNPTVELILNSKDPLERQFAEQTINARVNEVEQAVSQQVLRVAVYDLQQVLNGGKLQFLGQNVPLLGLRNSRAIVQGTIASLPKDSPLRPALTQVANFADLAIQGLGFASPVLGSIGSPLTVETTQLAGKTTPTDTYAAAIAVIVSLMFVALLLAAGLLAIERSENAYSRLIRGLVSPLAAAVGEGLAVGALRGRGDARDGDLRVGLHPPRVGAVSAVGARPGLRRTRVRRARRADRRNRSRGQCRVVDGVPGVATDRVHRPDPGERGLGRAEVRARRDLVLLPVQGGAAGREQRIQRDLARDLGPAAAPGRARGRVRGAGAGGAAEVRPR